jgi:hypothetical protein
MKRKIRRRSRNIFGAVCLSTASSISAGTFTPASAQNANPYAPTQSPPPPAQSVPQASPPPIGQPPSTPPPDMGPIAQLHAWGTSLGKTLADDGIYLSAPPKRGACLESGARARIRRFQYLTGGSDLAENPQRVVGGVRAGWPRPLFLTTSRASGRETCAT